MKKRYARILAATLSAAMVFTSAPASVFDTGVIEAEAAKLNATSTNVLADGNASIDATHTAVFATGKALKDYAKLPTPTSNYVTYVATATGDLSSGGGTVTATIYAVLDKELVVGVEDGDNTATKFVAGDLTDWAADSGNVSGDADNYVKALDGTQSITVLKKGTQTALDALFPTELKVTYGTTDIANATGWVAGKAATAYNISGVQNLKDLSVGGSLDATLELKVTPSDTSWAGLTGYNAETGKLSKTVKVTCVKADSASTIDATTDENPVLRAQYGTGNVKLYTTYVSETATNNVEATKWTLKSVKDTIRTADAGDTVDAEIQSVQTFDSTKYDMDKYCKTTLNGGLDTPYYFENGRIIKKVTVTVVKAVVDPDTIAFPTTTTKVTFGDNYAEVKLGKYGNEAIGKYWLADTSGSPWDALAIDDDKTAAMGDKTVDIAFELDSNHQFAGQSSYSKYNVDLVNGILEYANGFKVEVQKKLLEAKDVAPQLTVKKLPYGSTVTDVQDALAANSYVTYAPVAAGSTKLKTGKQNVEFVAQIPGPTFANTAFAGNNDELKVSVEVEVVTPAIAVMLVDADGTTPATSAGVGINNNKVLKVAIAGGKDGDTYIKDNAQIKSYQWYVVENGTAKALPEETAASLTVTPKVAATRQYYCEVVLEAKDNANKDDTKALLSSSAIATNKITVYSSKFTMTTGGSADGATYKNTGTFEDITATLNPHTGYSVVAKEASYKDEAGKVTATSITNAGNAFTIAVPTTLEAGKYEFTAKVTLESDSTDETDTVYFVESYEVEQATIALTDLYAKKKNELDAKLDKTSYVYGTKTSDMVLTSGTTLGTLKIATSNPDYFNVGDQNIALTYVPNAFAEKNYTKASIDALNSNPGLIVATEIKKAPLTITADNLELVVGDAKPAVSKLTYSYEGVVAKDEFAKLGATVTLSYAPTVTDEMLAKVGTIKEGIRITAAVTSGNYEVKAVRGDIIITDGKAPAPTTPPTVAPTPAPVKQATAAAPKAAKAKVSVKAGKKYTLKLKYAAGKKATVKKVKWTSSKKSVATVSSKGKVTAKKAGKATIYARVYFKDGSMKKIKFTVTVK